MVKFTKTNRKSYTIKHILNPNRIEIAGFQSRDLRYYRPTFDHLSLVAGVTFVILWYESSATIVDIYAIRIVTTH